MHRKCPKIYTKTGDDGTTCLYNGTRLPKTDAIFDALGTIDELNSAIGIIRAHTSDHHKQLENIQQLMLDIGSNIAMPRNDHDDDDKLAKTTFPDDHTAELESAIDSMTDKLPKLTKFILPGGCISSSHTHMARSICRRAERKIFPLIAEGTVDKSVGKYLNRLSDFLFTLARHQNYLSNVTEELRE